jgi:NAD(P)-dependent dehydrogenase (short-subunit alcohol dehydrogenase family)
MLAEAMANGLPEDGEGLIVNIIDQRVWKLTPRFFSYTLSKSALWTATQTMAQALAPRIRVNAIGPGPTLANERQQNPMISTSRPPLCCLAAGRNSRNSAQPSAISIRRALGDRPDDRARRRPASRLGNPGCERRWGIIASIVSANLLAMELMHRNCMPHEADLAPAHPDVDKIAYDSHAAHLAQDPSQGRKPSRRRRSMRTPIRMRTNRT